MASDSFDAATFDDDLARAVELGLGHLRFALPWASMQPRAGAVDGDVVERYRLIAERTRSAGIEPWFSLLQPAVPIWFDNEGGFTDARFAARFWPRWVETAAESVGHLAAGWVPFEAPFAVARRMIPDHPARHGELTDTLVVAWRDAWRILRGGPPVATCLDLRVVRPVDQTIQAGALAKREDQLRWGLWFDGLADGTIVIPGRADRDLPDLAGACDVFGLAVTGEPETILYRAAEMARGRPMALTYRPLGDSDRDRSSAVEAFWAEARRALDELPVGQVTMTPFIDPSSAARGMLTAGRDITDAGHAFARR